MTVPQELIDLVRKHMSVIASRGLVFSEQSSSTPRRVHNVAKDVNIIPEYPIIKTVLAESRPIGGVVDFLMANLFARYTYW